MSRGITKAPGNPDWDSEPVLDLTGSQMFHYLTVMSQNIADRMSALCAAIRQTILLMGPVENEVVMRSRLIHRVDWVRRYSIESNATLNLSFPGSARTPMCKMR